MSRSIDWFALSKLSPEPIELNRLYVLLPLGTSLSEVQIAKVPRSMQLHLLRLVQSASQQMQEEQEALKRLISEAEIGKSIISRQQWALENELKSSVQYINTLKTAVAQKKQFLKSLQTPKNVGRTEVRSTDPTEKYYCPLCDNADFSSREMMRGHMKVAHNLSDVQPSRTMSDDSFPEFKDLLLTLKDKEMQIMEMLLKQNKELQTAARQSTLFHEIQKLKASALQNSPDEELKGSSQYVLYRKSDLIRREVEARELQMQDNIENRFTEALPENQSLYEHQKNKPMTRSVGISANEYASGFDQSPTTMPQQPKALKQPMLSRGVLFQPMISYIPLKSDHNLNFNESNNARPSISDRLAGDHLNSMSRRPPATSIEGGYLFNAGVMVDDYGEDSFYEDYFNEETLERSEVPDEQIRMLHYEPLGAVQEASVRTIIYDQTSRAGQDQSDLVDLSDSMSRNDITKGDLSIINLSDLRISKLMSPPTQKAQPLIPNDLFAKNPNQNQPQKVSVLPSHETPNSLTEFLRK